MARILCCYTRGDPVNDGRFHVHNSRTEAMDSIRAHAPQADLIDVTGDDLAYWREIRARWDGTDDLVIVEHDIQIGPDTIGSLVSCDKPWCVFAYDIFGVKRITNALGCTRFSAELQRAVPLELVEKRFEVCGNCDGKGCWWHIDAALADELENAGFASHVHGDIPHLHDYAAPGTIPLTEGIASFYSWEAGSEPVQVHVALPLGAGPDLNAIDWG